MLRTCSAMMIALTLVAGGAQAQKGRDLKALHAKKLESPFLQRGLRWSLDYDRTLDSARTMEKFGDVMIFAYFTRSYAP